MNVELCLEKIEDIFLQGINFDKNDNSSLLNLFYDWNAGKRSST